MNGYSGTTWDFWLAVGHLCLEKKKYPHTSTCQNPCICKKVAFWIAVHCSDPLCMKGLNMSCLTKSCSNHNHSNVMHSGIVGLLVQNPILVVQQGFQQIIPWIIKISKDDPSENQHVIRMKPQPSRTSWLIPLKLSENMGKTFPGRVSANIKQL